MEGKGGIIIIISISVLMTCMENDENGKRIMMTMMMTTIMDGKGKHHMEMAMMRCHINKGGRAEMRKAVQ